MLNRFHRVPERDGRTERQTDGQSKCSQVDGCVDPEIIADKFVQHFRTNISCNNIYKAEVLKQSYLTMRATYCGLPITESYKFDTELVSKIITELKRGNSLTHSLLRLTS